MAQASFSTGSRSHLLPACASVNFCRVEESALLGDTLQQHGLGKDSGTVSRQGCRRPSDTWTCLKRVPEALPNP